MEDVEHVDSTLMETISGNVSRIGKAAQAVKRIIRGSGKQ
jgi:hypothetical protein